jgi:hypothetical protein
MATWLAGGEKGGSRPPRERKDHGDALLPGCLLWVTSVGRVPALSRWCADVTTAESSIMYHVKYARGDETDLDGNVPGATAMIV